MTARGSQRLRAPLEPGTHLRQHQELLAVGSVRKAQLDAMAQQATVDCYHEAEQLTDFFTPTLSPAGAEWSDAYRHWLG